MSPLEALSALVRAPRPPPPDPAGRDELGPEEAKALIGGPEAGALYSFWRDACRGRDMGDDLLVLALVRTCEVWGSGDTTSTLDETTDDAFTVVSRNDLPPDVVRLFLAAWEEAVSRRRERRQPRSARDLWFDVTARNTLVALAPERPTAEEVLGADDPTALRWSTATIYAVAMPAPYNRLYPRSLPTWDRFGDGAGVVLDRERTGWMRAAWSVTRVRAVLAQAARELHGPLRAAASEALELRLEDALPRRVEQMHAKLQRPAPSEWWDDEYGTVAEDLEQL